MIHEETALPTTAENYLFDLGPQVWNLAREAQRSASASNDAFERGRQLALYSVLDLMKQQAEAFGLDQRAIGLGGVNIEHLLK